MGFESVLAEVWTGPLPAGWVRTASSSAVNGYQFGVTTAWTRAVTGAVVGGGLAAWYLRKAKSKYAPLAALMLPALGAYFAAGTSRRLE